MSTLSIQGIAPPTNLETNLNNLCPMSPIQIPKGIYIDFYNENLFLKTFKVHLNLFKVLRFYDKTTFGLIQDNFDSKKLPNTM